MAPGDDSPALLARQRHPDVAGLVAIDLRVGNFTRRALEDPVALGRPGLRPRYPSSAASRIELSELCDYARCVH
jgi:hypothetical protein